MNISNSLKTNVGILHDRMFGLNCFKGSRLIRLSIGTYLDVSQTILSLLIRKFRCLLQWLLMILLSFKVLLDMQFSIHCTLWMIKIFNFQSVKCNITLLFKVLHDIHTLDFCIDINKNIDIY
jgi:hypothetical protein